MSLTTTKTYFWVSRNSSDEIKNGNTDAKIFTFHFPPEFIASRNRKWIIVEECKACGCNFISMLYYNYDQEIFDELKEAGIDCYAWTVDTIENADWMYQFNNHEVAIITNKPQLFWEY